MSIFIFHQSRESLRKMSRKSVRSVSTVLSHENRFLFFFRPLTKHLFSINVVLSGKLRHLMSFGVELD